MDAAIRSGSMDILSPTASVPKEKVGETELSRSGLGFNSADTEKGRLNQVLRERDSEALSEEEMNFNLSKQIGDKVNKCSLECAPKTQLQGMW